MYDNAEVNFDNVESIEDYLQEIYDYITIEIDKGRKTNEYIFYISIRLTDFKNNDTVKSIRFKFYWNRHVTNETNYRQLKSKIDNSIIKFFMKEV